MVDYTVELAAVRSYVPLYASKNARLLTAISSMLILVIGLVVTQRLWQHTQDIARLEVQAKFDSRVREVADRISHHMMSYVLVLRGAEAMLSTTNHISRKKFTNYLDTLHLHANYPGILSVTLAEISARGRYSSFTIHRESSRQQNSGQRSRKDDALCRASMRKPDNLDQLFMTSKLEQAIAGFLLCIPLYATGSSHTTAISRRASIVGWLSMRFRMESLMFGILGDLYQDNSIEIYDGEVIAEPNLLYRSGISASVQFSAIKHIEIAGHYWTLSLKQPDSGLVLNKGNAQLVLYAGGGLSLLLSILSWILLTGRASAIKTTEMLGHELIERRRAEGELLLAATVYSTMDEAVTVTDANNHFVSVNPAFTTITGYTKQEVLGKNPSMLSSGLMSPKVYCKMWESLSSTGMWQGEVFNRRKTGELYYEWISIKVVTDNRGNLLNYIAVFSDISKRKATENFLRESSETLHSVIETAMDAVVMTDDRGTIIKWNARAEEVLGWSKEEACGRDLQNMFTPFKYQDGSVSSLRQLLLIRNSAVRHSLIETTAIHRDGHEFPVELTAAQIKIKGKRAFSCFIHDVSTRRDRDSALQTASVRAEDASRAKSDFLANMSHEIRTPMNSILGMAYLTLTTELSAKQRDYIEKINYSAQHLLGIINDILDFSKIEAGKLRIENVELNPHILIENTANMLASKAAEKGLQLDYVIAPDIPQQLCGDPLRLGQVLINYISNAIKFTEHGSVTIHASKVEESASQIILRFEVRDSGIGISSQDMANLFQVFQQADMSTTRKFGGTGLGLAISKQLAELMGGKVGAESKQGKGSTFWFTASLEKRLSIPNENKLPDEKNSMSAQQALVGAQVLLVEDNLFNQQVATDLLELAAVKVTVANNGKEALEIMRIKDFDCVLMDMQMPEMDGLEATRCIRADAALSDTLIIAMTANTRKEDRDSCIAAGMDDILTKPILPSLLYSTLASRLTKRELQPASVISTDETVGGLELINIAVLSRMVGHDRSRIEKYAVKFLHSAQEGVEKISAAVSRHEFDALSALGHRIKSSARTVGAIDFANLCQALEQPRLRLHQAESIVSEMRRLLALIEKQVEGILNGHAD